MGYLHISNLSKDQTILMFRECYALEKVHGTSAHVSFNDGKLGFFSGGESYENFKAFFDEPALLKAFQALGHNKIIVYGEAYGGRCQGMKKTYGEQLRFIAFDVKIDECWLDVPNAADVVSKLDLEFVPYEKISTDIATIDAERDRPSRVAIRRGMGNDKIAEGIVLRPLVEMRTNDGERVIVKHKRAEFSERESKKDTVVIDPAKMEVLSIANKIADEWVTDIRLEHVVDKLKAEKGTDLSVEDTGRLLRNMVEDVYREAGNEIVQSKEANKVISGKTAKMFQKYLERKLH